MTIAENIRQTIAVLQERAWIQGAYFRADADGSIGCCLHGACQLVVNPPVSKILQDSPLLGQEKALAWAAVEEAAAPAAVVAAADAVAAPADKTELLAARPAWANATHYWLGLCGATAAFNDAPGRTKEEIIAKLEYAAEEAEKAGV